MATRRPKQEKIPGTERKVHKDIRGKAEELYEVRGERMALSKREKTLADELLVLMKKHGLTEHREEELIISIVPEGEKIKVKKAPDGDEE